MASSKLAKSATTEIYRAVLLIVKWKLATLAEDWSLPFAFGRTRSVATESAK